MHNLHVVEEGATRLDQREELDPNGSQELLLELRLDSVVSDGERSVIVKHMFTAMEGVVASGRDQLRVELSRHVEGGVVTLERNKAFSIVVTLEHQHHRASRDCDRVVALALARVNDLESFLQTLVRVEPEDGLRTWVEVHGVDGGLVEESGPHPHRIAIDGRAPPCLPVPMHEIRSGER